LIDFVIGNFDMVMPGGTIRIDNTFH